jgi:hypothetical protein
MFHGNLYWLDVLYLWLWVRSFVEEGSLSYPYEVAL